MSSDKNSKDLRELKDPTTPKEEVDGADAAKSKKKKKKKTSKENGGVYVNYIAKIAKQIGAERGVSWAGKTLRVVDHAILDVEERVTDTAVAIAKARGKTTISPAHLAAAYRIVLPRNLAQSCIAESARAIARFQAAAA